MYLSKMKSREIFIFITLFDTHVFMLRRKFEMIPIKFGFFANFLICFKASRISLLFMYNPFLLQLNYYSQYTAFSTKTMTFNKSEFAQRTSCNATIPLWARFTMEEDPVLRQVN